MKCEMINVHPGEDGLGVESQCQQESAGIDENGVRVCRECGEGSEREGFRVNWDMPVQP